MGRVGRSWAQLTPIS
uniref:Uncharacterized protein n=1 Tax=Arundo donax TaxID=35708 RepID=A0A0A8YTE1_ARUDO